VRALRAVASLCPTYHSASFRPVAAFLVGLQLLFQRLNERLDCFLRWARSPFAVSWSLATVSVTRSINCGCSSRRVSALRALKAARKSARASPALPSRRGGLSRAGHAGRRGVSRRRRGWLRRRPAGGGGGKLFPRLGKLGFALVSCWRSSLARRSSGTPAWPREGASRAGSPGQGRRARRSGGKRQETWRGCVVRGLKQPPLRSAR